MPPLYWIRNKYGLHLAHNAEMRQQFETPIRATIKPSHAWTCKTVGKSKPFEGNANSEQEAKDAVMRIVHWEYRPEEGY